MDIPSVINKYASIKTVTNDKLVEEITEELRKLPETEMKEYFAGTERTGAVFLYESKKSPGNVVEVVQGLNANDRISTLFVGHPLMGTKQTWLDARAEMMRAAESVFGAPEGCLALMDHARGRHVMLQEMSTAQIYDLVVDSERRVELPK